MTNIEIKAWELIGQLSPAQQYYFALKILQGVKPKDIDGVSTDEISDKQHDSQWKGEEEVINLILERKNSLEDGSVLPISLEQFKDKLYKDIEQRRS